MANVQPRRSSSGRVTPMTRKVVVGTRDQGPNNYRNNRVSTSQYSWISVSNPALLARGRKMLGALMVVTVGGAVFIFVLTQFSWFFSMCITAMLFASVVSALGL